MIDRERLARAGREGFLRIPGGVPPWTALTDAQQQGYLAVVDAILADIAAQQHAVVPREPTEKMMNAGYECIPDYEPEWDDARAIYQAMLSAAEEGG